MTFSYTSTTSYPAFATKQAILREILRVCHNVPDIEDLLYRLNNTAMQPLSDGDTRYDPVGSFGTVETADIT